VEDQLTARLDATIETDRVTLRHGGDTTELATSPHALSTDVLAAHDPPRPEDLTNSLGEVFDRLEDVLRGRPTLASVTTVHLTGDEAWHLACVERGTSAPGDPVTISRVEIEDLFRTLATERRGERLHNPALEPERVDTIVGACCVALALMRRLQISDATFTANAEW
jgi:exopolyphosphatase/guanosine-5'-triphosphate,3'-diphosphate pyrophosphatase